MGEGPGCLFDFQSEVTPIGFLCFYCSYFVFSWCFVFIKLNFCIQEILNLLWVV